MPAFCHRLVLMLVSVLFFAQFAGRAHAQDTKQFDQRIYDTLKEVINAGADVYNARADDRDVYSRENNRAGCYRIYQGALLTLQPLLTHHPELQKTIDNSLAKAAKQSSMAERAFTLREALDEIRRALKPGGEEKVAGSAGSSDPGTASPNSLWSRLGGETKVVKIVDDLLGKVKSDPKVDFYRGGKFKPTDLEMQTTRARFVDYISAISKGPKAYRPGSGNRSMESIHRGMNITEAQFTAFMDDFRQVLAANDVKTPDGQELLQLIESTRKDIVGAKSPNDTLLDGFKRPVDKK